MTLRWQLSLWMGILVPVALGMVSWRGSHAVTTRFEASADRQLAAERRALEQAVQRDLERLDERLWDPAFDEQLLAPLARLASGELAPGSVEAEQLVERLAGRFDLPFFQVLDAHGVVLLNHHWFSDWGHVDTATAGPWPATRGGRGPAGAAARWILARDPGGRYPALVIGRRLQLGTLSFDAVAGLLFDSSALERRAASLGTIAGLEVAQTWFWALPPGQPATTRTALLAASGGGDGSRHGGAAVARWRPSAGRVQELTLGSEKLRVLAGPLALAAPADGSGGGGSASSGGGNDAASIRLAVAVSEAPLARALRDLYRVLWAVAGGGTVIALLLATYLARRIARPLEHTEAATRRVAAGALETRVEPRGSREMRSLAKHFNRMIHDLRERDALIEREHYGSWQAVARHIAHEIANNASAIRLAIDNLRRARMQQSATLPEVVESSVQSVDEEIKQLRRLMHEFSSFARLPAPRPVATGVDRLVLELVEVEPGDAASEASPAGAPQLSAQTDGTGGSAELDPDLIRAALRNLILNAHQAGGEDVHIEVRARGTAAEVVLEVADDGPGIPADRQRDIFRPYITFRRGGTGLGLAIVQRTAAIHGGRVELESTVGAGSCFRLILPRRFAGGTTAGMPAATGAQERSDACEKPPS